MTNSEERETETSLSESKNSSVPFADKFKIIGKLGEGANATVYEAEHLLLGSLVAIKILKESLLDDERSRARFLNEAKLALSLSHPNILKTIAFGFTDEGNPYIVMEKANGENLETVLKSRGKLTVLQCKILAEQIASALACAHEHNIVHRDVKPSNIFIDDSQEELQAKLLDFGIARRIVSDKSGSTLTQTGSILGTPRYMSPEQCKGGIADNRSDIYSLGCVIFECLSRSAPFSADSDFEILSKQVYESPDFSAIAEVSIDFSKLLKRCLEKDPQKRFQSSEELAVALKELTPVKYEKAKKKGIPKVLAISAFLLVVFAGLSALMQFQNSRLKDRVIPAADSMKPKSQLKPLGGNEIPYDQLAEEAVSCANARLPENEKGIDLMTRACNRAEKQGNKQFLTSRLPVLAAFYSRKGDYLASVKLLEKAQSIAIESKDNDAFPSIYRSWAQINKQNGKTKEALYMIEKAISLDEKAKRYLTSNYSSAADFASQVPYWKKAAKYAELAVLIGPDPAIDQFRTGMNGELKIKKDNWFDLPMYSIIIQKQARFHENKELALTLKKITDLGLADERSTADRILEAACLLFEENYTKETDRLLSCIKAGFDNSPLYETAIGSLKIQVLLRQGDLAKAETTCRNLLKSQAGADDMDRAILRSCLADILMERGNEQEGLALHKDAVFTAQKLPLNSVHKRSHLIDMLRRAARAFIKSGDLQDARASLDRAIATLPRNSAPMDRQDILESELRLQLAQVLKQSGDLEKFRIESQTALRLIKPYEDEYKDLVLEIRKLASSI